MKVNLYPLLRCIFSSFLLLAPFGLMAEMVEREVAYSIGDTNFLSTIVYDDEDDAVRPGILMVPNWMGPTEASLEKAKKIAGDDYVVMMVDMYGVGVRPSSSSEAGKAAGVIRGDRALMRERMQKAHEVFRMHEGQVPIHSDHLAAIGFCFGGGTVLEYARSGADLDAVVSFHGDLMSPTLKEDADQVKAKVLVLHGAEDPYVPQEHVQAFVSAMLETDVDWILVQFSNTVHSFTDPNANAEGQADYNPVSAERAFEMMEELFEELFEDEDD